MKRVGRMCCDLFVVRLLRWFFCLLGHGSFHFVLCFPPFLGALIIYDWQGFIIFDLLPIALERERERDSDPRQIWSRRLEWAVITRWLEIVDLVYSKVCRNALCSKFREGAKSFMELQADG